MRPDSGFSPIELGGVLHEIEQRLDQLVAIDSDRRQRRIVLGHDADVAGKSGVGEARDMVEDRVDVDRLGDEWALVAEHLHAIDEVLDAIGLGADQLGEGAIVVRQARLEELSGAANSRERILDLVGENGGEAGDGAGGGAMGELPLDHLCHGPLLEHDERQLGAFGQWS